VDPATFINDVEKKPMPTTVRKEVNAHANEAWLRELIIKCPINEK
jgi:hypothetical protein